MDEIGTIECTEYVDMDSTITSRVTTAEQCTEGGVVVEWGKTNLPRRAASQTRKEKKHGGWEGRCLRLLPSSFNAEVADGQSSIYLEVVLPCLIFDC
jgi:hypothetical protein